MSRVQKEAPSDQKEGTTESTAPKTDLKNEELEAATDDLLGEIDELLDEARGEQTAEEFVTNFVQRGGQ